MSGRGGSGGRGHGGRGRGRTQFRTVDPTELGFNIAAPACPSGQPSSSSGPSHPTHPPPSGPPPPSSTASRNKALDSFRGRLLSVLCMHPVIATNELSRAYREKHGDSMPDHTRLSFGSITAMLQACPNECVVANAASGPVTRQYVHLAPHWSGVLTALERRRGELIAANEQVTSSKLLDWIQIETNKSLEDLGLSTPRRFPYLLDLIRLEQSVELSILCYISDRVLAASLWDLERYICGCRGVNSFEELRLGPLTSDFRVKYIWRPTFSGYAAPQVSVSHVAAALKAAKDRKKGNILEAADVERELCRQFRVSSQHDLGIVFSEGFRPGWAISCLRRSREEEENAIKAEYAYKMEAIYTQAQARAEAQKSQAYQQARDRLFQQMQNALNHDPSIRAAAEQQALQRLGMQTQKKLQGKKGKLGQDSPKAGQAGMQADQESTDTPAPTSSFMQQAACFVGDNNVESAPMHPKVTQEDLVATVQRLGAGLGTSHAALADLERCVLAHYEGVLNFGALCLGVPSLLQLLEQQPALAAMLASPEDEGPAALGGPAVTMAQLLRAVAQATDAYRATHQSTAHKEQQAEGTDEESWVAQAICMQYNVGSVHQLGRGSLPELMALSQDWRHAASLSAARNVHAVSALVCGQQGAAKGALDSAAKGLLHSTDDMHSMARAALRSAPMLADLAQWTQWSAVFEDAVGSLDTELLDDAMDGWSVLELPGGQLIKVPSTTNLKSEFKESLAHLDPVATVAALLGYAAQEGNCSPVVLEPLIVHVFERMRDERKFSGNDDAREIMARFVLQCLSLIPAVLRPKLAQYVFLNPLMTEVMDGDAQATAKHLLQCANASSKDCHSGMVDKHTGLVDQRSQLLPMLHALGMDLKLNDLQDHYVEAVWRAGQVTAKDAPVQSAKAAVGFVPAAAASASPAPKSTSAKAAAGDTMELLPEGLRAHFVGGVQAAQGPEGAAGQVQQQEITAADQSPAQSSLQPGQAGVAASHEEQEALKVIHRLRTEEFGLVEEQHMTQDKKKDIERQGDMLQILSKELYSDAVHFQMELVQNADDNHYAPETCPLLEFEVHNDKIFIKNNELGFAADNVQAICAVGKSTKKNKKGYTGEKGIGFKSVFKVTDKPVIHSNHFHFAFDLGADNKLGYIVPSPVTPLPLELHNPKETGISTCIELPLKAEFQGKGPESQKLREKFNNLKPVLLLFLHKLRRIMINDKLRQSFQAIMADQDSVYTNCLILRSVRWNLAKNVVEEDTSSRWMHVSKIVQPRNLRQGAKVEETCVSVAYPLPSGADRELPERQPVYAFLPVRSYGLKFVVNANWEVPPSRELVHADNAFNLELRDYIPELAMEALRQFQDMPTPREGRPFFWTDWWLKTLPLEGEVDDPFATPARRLRMMASREQCIPTKSNLLVRPEQAHVCVDEGVRSLLAEERTQRLLDVHFVHPDIHCLYNSSRLCEQLRVRDFGASDLLSLARRVTAEPDLLKELGLKWLAQLLCCVFANVHEWTPQQKKHVLAGVRSLRILPLADGSFVSMAELEQEYAAALPPSASASSSPRLVFFALECLVQEAAAAQAEAQEAGRGADAARASTDAQSLLHASGLDWRQMRQLRQVHPMLLLQVEPAKASKLRWGLSELGVKQITAADIAQHHVLPMFRQFKQQLQQAQQAQQVADQEGTRQQLKAALAFVVLSGLLQDQSIYQPLRACAVIVTNRGLCHIPDAPFSVYLPPILGNNVVDLPKDFPSHQWVLVDPSYTSSSAASRRIDGKNWAYLFTILGAHKWLPLMQNNHNLDQAGWRQHLAAAAAAGIPCALSAADTAADCTGMGDAYAQLHDVSCPEFARLVASITHAWRNPPAHTPSSPATPLTQFMHLAKQMEAQWQSDRYATSMTTHVTLSAAAAAAEVVGEGMAGSDFVGVSGQEGSPAASQPIRVQVPTSFALSVRMCEWLLSSEDRPTRPTELFLESGYRSWLHGLVPYINQRRPDRVTDRGFLSALGVHMQLDLMEALALLKGWATRDNKSSSSTTTTTPTLLTSSSTTTKSDTGKLVAPDGTEVPDLAMAEIEGSGVGRDVRDSTGADGTGANSSGAQNLMGNRLRTSLDQMGALYAFIWEKVQHSVGLQALVVAFFAKYPLLWLPDKKGERPPKSRIEEGAFYSIACARHQDKACAMDAVPWERQQLRIPGWFYNGMDQLFKEPLWRPTPTLPDTPGPADQGTNSRGTSPAPPTSARQAGAAESAEADGFPDGVDEGGMSDGGGSEGGQDGDGGPDNGSSSDDDDDDDGGHDQEKGADKHDGLEQQQQQQGEQQHGLVAGCKIKLIQETPSLSEYVQALQALADSCLSNEMPYETAHHWVMLIFKMMSTYLKERRPGKFQVSGAELRSLIAPHLFGGEPTSVAPCVFPSSHQTFVSLQDNLLIKDDKELFKHFSGHPHIHFLHVSEAERKPNINGSLHTFLHVVGVPQLSTAVHPKVHRDASTFNPFHLQYTVYRALLLAQRFLFYKKRETSRTYEDLKQAGISRLFSPPGRCPFKVIAAEKLQVQYLLHQRQDATAEPAATDWLPCEAVLVGNHDLYVNDKAGSFDTQQVAQELSRLFHPASVSSVLSTPPGAAQLPSVAPKRDDLTDFLDAVLQRFKTGSEQEVEEYMSKRECFALPEGEEPWAELPVKVPSPAPTPAPVATGIHASDAGTAEEIADTDEDQKQQQQQQQSQRAPRPKNQFNSNDLWAALRGPPRSHNQHGTGGAGVDANKVPEHDGVVMHGEEGTYGDQGDSATGDTAASEAAAAEAAALAAEREREARAELLRQRNHQHAAFLDGQVEHQMGASSPVGTRAEGDKKRREGLHGDHASGEGNTAECALATRGGHHLSGESGRDAAREEQPHARGAERRVDDSHPSQAHTEPNHKGAPGTRHHGSGYEEKGVKGVCTPGQVPPVHAPRPAAEQGSLFGGAGWAGGSPIKGGAVWRSSAEAEAAARRDGLLQTFDPSQVLDVLGHAQAPSGDSLLNAFPHAATAAALSSPDYLLAVGSWGERIALAWIRAKVANSNTSVTWENEDGEKGLPFDILVTDLTDTSKKIYVEVKTSRSILKSSFPISRNELEFAAQAGDAYHVFWLRGAGASNPDLSQIVNPVQRWTEGAVSVEMSCASYSS